ncbi:hypothetical protein CWM47_30765 [Spirosoma pollinicola]|uniref:Uncharacterized protein n=1 Tax=Spirosoma pollinicola TaxID=2057025 RepID=A0A2K8Z7M8_9BACT|nr:hypothetical protein CWM47_30765 [Spirosoma pollinicola]
MSVGDLQMNAPRLNRGQKNRGTLASAAHIVSQEGTAKRPARVKCRNSKGAHPFECVRFTISSLAKNLAVFPEGKL